MVISLLVLGLLCVRAAYLSPAPLLSTRRHAAAAPRGGLLHLAEAETVVSPFADGEGGATAAGDGPLELTMENVDLVLDEMRPYLLADGGNVAVRSVDGGVIELELQGACGSCPSSSMTMKMGLERGLREKFADIVDVVQVAPDGPVVRCPPRTPHPPPRAPAHPALNAPPRVPQLDEAGIEEVLEQIRPFLAMVPALRPRTSPRAGRARAFGSRHLPLALCGTGGRRGRANQPRARRDAAHRMPQNQRLRCDDQLRARRDRPAPQAKLPNPRQRHLGLKMRRAAAA